MAAGFTDLDVPGRPREQVRREAIEYARRRPREEGESEATGCLALAGALAIVDSTQERQTVAERLNRAASFDANIESRISVGSDLSA